MMKLRLCLILEKENTPMEEKANLYKSLDATNRGCYIATSVKKRATIPESRG